MIVVDASVAVKWFFAEPLDEAAHELLENAQPLVAPALIRVEVAAAILKKARLGQVLEMEAKAALDLWLQASAAGALSIVADERDIDRGAEIALALRHPLQDCLYLALAERLGVPLVTADTAFVRVASSTHPSVKPLGGT